MAACMHTSTDCHCIKDAHTHYRSTVYLLFTCMRFCEFHSESVFFFLYSLSFAQVFDDHE